MQVTERDARADGGGLAWLKFRVCRFVYLKDGDRSSSRPCARESHDVTFMDLRTVLLASAERLVSCQQSRGAGSCKTRGAGSLSARAVHCRAVSTLLARLVLYSTMSQTSEDVPLTQKAAQLAKAAVADPPRRRSKPAPGSLKENAKEDDDEEEDEEDEDSANSSDSDDEDNVPLAARKQAGAASSSCLCCPPEVSYRASWGVRHTNALLPSRSAVARPARGRPGCVAPSCRASQRQRHCHVDLRTLPAPTPRAVLHMQSAQSARLAATAEQRRQRPRRSREQSRAPHPDRAPRRPPRTTNPSSGPPSSTAASSFRQNTCRTASK